MATSIYIVVFARGAWWIDLDGRSDGPFPDLETASNEAISRATSDSKVGGRSEVRVSGPGHDNELAYQSADRSILSRAVATAHRH